MNKMKLESMNMTQHNIDRIAEMFPQVVTEVAISNEELGVSNNSDDKNSSSLNPHSSLTRKAIDFEKLKLVLSAGTGDYVLADDERERYEFTWVGKRQAMIDAATPIRKTLRPCPEESVNFDTTENIYIEGDNLEVLKLLQESYLGKVKMIYIDPPYNTGRDFVYRDNFTKGAEEYNEESGMYDEEDNKLFQNTETNGRFHSDWCSMIYPRLQLARNLLTDDGVIFISIDDTEVENLRKICDEVFGAKNYVNTICVKMSEASGTKMSHTDKRLPKLKEYILMYKKNEIYLTDIKVPKESWDTEYNKILTNISDEEIAYIKSVILNETRDNIEIKKCSTILNRAEYITLTERYKELGISSKDEKLKYCYNNSHRIFQTVSMSGGTSTAISKARIANCRNIFFPYITPESKMYIINGDYDDSVKKPRMQLLFADEYLTYNPCDLWQDIKTTGLDNEGFVPYKSGKKPLKLINRVIAMLLSTSKNDIVLDFFSGSSTTAEGVMRFNYENNSRHKFIMVQVDEDLDKNLLTATDNGIKKSIKESIKLLDSIGKPHKVCELAKERIRRAGAAIMRNEELGARNKEQSKKLLDKNIPNSSLLTPNLDLGFRVFKLDSTNMKDVYYSAGAISQANLFSMESNIKDDRTDIDLLYGALLDWGVELTYPHTAEQIDGYTVHTVHSDPIQNSECLMHNNAEQSNNYELLIACFDENISETAIREIASRKPLRALFRDHSFKDSANKINVYEIFKAVAPDTSVKVM